MTEGDELGRYRLLFRIATGGMAEVWAALNAGEAGFEKVVAVKRMLPELAEEEKFVDMFLDEARISATIHSPHAVETLDLGRDDDGAPYLVMDLVVGANLAELERDARKLGGDLPVTLFAELIAQAALGLHDAHEARQADGSRLDIVHRDVSPQNVLVGVDGITRLTDFGIARAFDRRTRSLAGQLKGKFAYFAPEQAAGEPLDRRSDIFALSIVAWEMFANRRLYDGDDEAIVLQQAASMAIPPLGGVCKDLPPMLAAAIDRGLVRDPAGRFQTAADMAKAIRAAIGTPPDRADIARYVRETSTARIENLEHRIRVAVGKSKPGADEATIVERKSDRAISGRKSDRGGSGRGSSQRRGSAPSARGSSRDDAAVAAPTGVDSALGTRKRGLLIAAAVIAVGVTGGLAVGWRMQAKSSAKAGGASAGTTAAGKAEDRALATRACKEWSRALARYQRPDGGMGLEPQRPATGFTTAQQLFAMCAAHSFCGEPGPAPLRLGFTALAQMRQPDGWWGNKWAETPATAWALLALGAGRHALADATLEAEVATARDMMIVAQSDDGGFRTRPSFAGEPTNEFSSVLALWALAATAPIAETERGRTARLRAADWMRKALTEDVGEPPLRTTAGLHEHGAWALLKARALPGGARPGDSELFTRVAREIVARCRLGADKSCARPIYENGQTYLMREPGKPPEMMTLWHPWVTVLTGELAADKVLIPDAALRAELAAIHRWGVREIEEAVSSLTVAPSYKIAEYLFVVSTF